MASYPREWRAVPAKLGTDAIFQLPLPAKQVLPRMPTNQMSARSLHTYPARKFAGVTGEKNDFYHRGN